MTPGTIDLHLHSTASDGRLDPAALVAHAQACGVRVLALTDHDTTAGLEDAVRAGTTLGVTVLAGVEVSAEWRGRTVHVLGIGIDPEAGELAGGLAALADERERRAADIARRLAIFLLW